MVKWIKIAWRYRFEIEVMPDQMDGEIERVQDAVQAAIEGVPGVKKVYRAGRWDNIPWKDQLKGF